MRDAMATAWLFLPLDDTAVSRYVAPPPAGAASAPAARLSARQVACCARHQSQPTRTRRWRMLPQACGARSACLPRCMPCAPTLLPPPHTDARVSCQHVQRPRALRKDDTTTLALLAAHARDATGGFHGPSARPPLPARSALRGKERASLSVAVRLVDAHTHAQARRCADPLSPRSSPFSTLSLLPSSSVLSRASSAVVARCSCCCRACTVCATRIRSPAAVVVPVVVRRRRRRRRVGASFIIDVV